MGETFSTNRENIQKSVNSRERSNKSPAMKTGTCPSSLDLPNTVSSFLPITSENGASFSSLYSGTLLYDAGDPSAEERPLNDSRFALDHFMTKLFKLCEGFKTATGRRLAAERHARLQRFYDDLLEEI